VEARCSEAIFQADECFEEGMLHQPIYLLICLIVASMLAWYGISVWEVEFGAHAPIPMEAGDSVKIKREVTHKILM
jgi:hypothetical protein